MNDDVGTLIEPAAVRFTWGAPGWYVVGIVLLLLLTAIVLFAYHYYRKNRYRRAALAWLAAQESQFNERPDRLIYEATMLLKRIVMARYGRSHAAIRETEWIAFLNDACTSPLFSDTDGPFITRALYAHGNAIARDEVAQYLEKTRRWIKRHRYAL